MRGVFEMNIGKLGTWKNSKFFFGWRRALVGVGVTRGGLCKVGYVRWIMQGGLCKVGGRVWGGHARWVMQGGSCEVGYARWVSHKVGLM